jgi:hypothetical protein
MRPNLFSICNNTFSKWREVWMSENTHSLKNKSNKIDFKNSYSGFNSFLLHNLYFEKMYDCWMKAKRNGTGFAVELQY